MTVHGTGALADAIKKDSANAQKLANVAALQASPDASAADKISTDEGTVAGKYEALRRGCIRWSYRTRGCS